MRMIVIAVLALASCGATTETSNQSIAAKARALDGDTLAVDIRLLGVDAFERRQLCEREGGCWQCGKAAQDFSADALRAGTASIRLTSSTSYDRLVAVVTVDGQDLGERLVRAGLAIPQPQYLRDDPARAGR